MAATAVASATHAPAPRRSGFCCSERILLSRQNNHAVMNGIRKTCEASSLCAAKWDSAAKGFQNTTMQRIAHPTKTTQPLDFKGDEFFKVTPEFSTNLQPACGELALETRRLIDEMSLTGGHSRDHTAL